MLLVLIACALTVLLVNAIRHSSADYAWEISIVAGSVAYAVIMIAGTWHWMYRLHSRWF